MKAKHYTSERAAKKAAAQIRAMWPNKSTVVSASGFGTWAVYCGGYICAKLAPLPFTVTRCRSLIVYQIVSKSGTVMHGGKCWPTHRQALNALRRFSPMCFVSPVEFVGPVTPQVDRRIRHLAQTA